MPLGEPTEFVRTLAAILASAGWQQDAARYRWTHPTRLTAAYYTGTKVTLSREGGFGSREVRSLLGAADDAAFDVASQLALAVAGREGL